MDIDVIHSGLLSIGITVGKIHDARTDLPPGEVAAEIGAILALAEVELKVAEGMIAREIGFELCPDCWPPELIVVRQRGEMRCRNCERGFGDGSQGSEDREIEQFGMWREAITVVEGGVGDDL